MDEGQLARLKNLRGLTGLQLYGWQLSKKAYRLIASFPDLPYLGLGSTPIDNEALADLRALRKLRWLDLKSTRITDAAVKTLVQFPNLSELYVSALSPAAIKKLTTALPRCKIVTDQATFGPVTAHARGPADQEKPFVLLAKDGSKRGEYRHFWQAFNARKMGDTIEVHGNGPFHVGGMESHRLDLSIRAAPGYRPRFERTGAPAKRVGGCWFWTDAPLRVEGCDFVNSGGVHMGVHMFVAEFDSGPWEFQNCRFFGAPGQSVAGGSIARYRGPSLTLRGCLVDQPNQGIACLVVGEDTTVHLEKNTFRAGTLFYRTDFPGEKGKGNRLHLVENTVHCDWLLHSLRPIDVEGSGNLLVLGSGSFPQHTNDYFRKNKTGRWRGSKNLYVGCGHLKALNEFWGREEPASREVPHVRFRWDELSEASTEGGIARLRQETESARQHLKKDSSVGPDWPLVGPGDGYVLALAIAGKPVYKEHLRPKPPDEGPFAIIRDGKLVTGVPTLRQAADATLNGDTIEIRGDGPFAGAELGRGWGKDPKTLTLRAAPGYRPVIDGGIGFPGAGHGNPPRLIIEGIHFHKGGLAANVAHPGVGCTVLRLANCSFEGRDDAVLNARGFRAPAVGTGPCLFQGDNGKPAEIVNCFIPGVVRAVLSPESKLIVRNSVIGHLSAFATAEKETAVELEDSVLWNPGGSPLFVSQAWPYQPKKTFTVALAARRTLFEGGGDWLVLSGGEGPVRYTWTGEGNVYRLGPWLDLTQHSKQYQSPETGSVTADPVMFDPEQWRLLPSSPGSKLFGRGADPDRRVAEWTIRNGGSVRLVGAGAVAQLADLPAGPFKVCQVHPNRLIGDDPELATLAALTDLVDLRLQASGIGDGTLHHIGKAAKLAHLNLMDTKITDAGMPAVANLKQLAQLVLARTRVTDAGLEHVHALARLDSLDLAWTAISDVGLPRLAGLKNLQHLCLRFTKVTAAGVAGLQKDLPKCRIEWDGNLRADRRAAEWVRSRGGSITLRHRDAPPSASPVTLAAKDYLSHAGEFSLLEIDLKRSKVTDAELANLKGLNGLTTLILDSTPIGDAGLAHLKDLHTLTQLRLSETAVSDVGLAYLKNLPKLFNLSLSGTRVTDRGLYHVRELSGLVSLALGATSVSDQGLEQLKTLKKLRQLYLHRTNVTDAGLVHLRGLRLHDLGLRGTRITDAGADRMMELASMRELDLRETNVSAAAVARLRQALAGCTVLWEQGK